MAPESGRVVLPTIWFGFKALRFEGYGFIFGRVSVPCIDDLGAIDLFLENAQVSSYIFCTLNICLP